MDDLDADQILSFICVLKFEIRKLGKKSLILIQKKIMQNQFTNFLFIFN